MVDNPDTLALIPSAIALTQKAVLGQREPWVIMPGSSLEKGYKPIFLGQDELSQSLILPSMSTASYIVRLPHVNVNASKKAINPCEVVDGVYLYIAHYHHWGKSDAYPAFFITHFSATGPVDIDSLSKAYRSQNRVNLPIVGGGYDSYINFHRSDRYSDGSEGCWTVPRPDFDLFRNSYQDLQWGVVFKCTSNPSVGVRLLKEIRSAYGL